MGGLRNLLVLGIALLVALALLGMFLASLALAAALLVPLAGLGWLVTRLQVSWRLWRSGGRLPMGDAVRVIGSGRAKALAVAEAVRGAGGLLVSAAAPLLFYSSNISAAISLAAGAGALWGAGRARRRLEAGANPIDVLPPGR